MKHTPSAGPWAGISCGRLLLKDCEAMHAVLVTLLQSDMHQKIVETLGNEGVELSEVYRTILKAKGE